MILTALTEAQLEPSKVNAMETHGTGTVTCLERGACGCSIIAGNLEKVGICGPTKRKNLFVGIFFILKFLPFQSGYKSYEHLSKLHLLELIEPTKPLHLGFPRLHSLSVLGFKGFGLSDHLCSSDFLLLVSICWKHWDS